MGTDILGPSGQVIGGDGTQKRMQEMEEAIVGLENVRVQLMRTICVLVARQGGEAEVSDAELAGADAYQLGVLKHPIKAATVIKVMGLPKDMSDGDSQDV